jgi:hypothetical protein
VIFINYVIISIFFLLELAMLAAYSYWGFRIDKGMLTKLLFGIGIPIVVAVIWGTFISPKASIPVTTTIRIVLQAILFGCSVLALYYSGKTTLAVIFGMIILIEMILMYVLDL